MRLRSVSFEPVKLGVPMRVVIVVLLGCVALSTSACAKKGNKATTIVGTWQSATGNSVEFRPDGTATITASRGMTHLNYTWRDGQAINLTAPAGGRSMDWKVVSLTDQELVVTDPENTRTVMRRVR